MNQSNHEEMALSLATQPFREKIHLDSIASNNHTELIELFDETHLTIEENITPSGN